MDGTLAKQSPLNLTLSAMARVMPEQELKKASTTSGSQYFEKPVYRTVSAQLHLEAICNGIAKEGKGIHVLAAIRVNC